MNVIGDVAEANGSQKAFDKTHVGWGYGGRFRACGAKEELDGRLTSYWLEKPSFSDRYHVAAIRKVDDWLLKLAAQPGAEVHIQLDIDQLLGLAL